MKAIETITGRVSVLDRDDIDTDQIIPKQFLKRVERTGFGEFLFYDWAQEPGLGAAAQPDPARRAQLRLRLQPRARAVGAGGLRLPGRDRVELRRHLPLQLHQERPAPGPADPRAVRVDRRGGGGPGRPGRAAGALGAGRVEASFEIDPEIKHRLLNGLDDIALTLAQDEAIGAFESRRERVRLGRTRHRARCEHPRLGRRDLRPDLGSPAGLGGRAARSSRADRRRVGARRRLRLGQGHGRDRAPRPAGPRLRGRRGPLDGAPHRRRRWATR